MKIKLLSLFALVLCMSAILIAGTTTAIAVSPEIIVTEAETQTSGVTETRLTNEAPEAAVTPRTNETVNAEAQPAEIGEAGEASEVAESDESAVPGGAFTPDGTGAVVDNVTDGGKEFYTITTADGNVFYLIIDSERASDNVYFLNAVTEQDLMSLAKPGDEQWTVDSGQLTVAPTPTAEPTPEPPSTIATEKSGGNGGSIAFVAIAVVAIGGAAYYVKIVRPKRVANDDDFDDEQDEQLKVEDEEESDDRFEEDSDEADENSDEFGEDENENLEEYTE